MPRSDKVAGAAEVPKRRLRVEKGCIDRNGASGLLVRSLCDAEPEIMNARSAAAIACNQGFFNTQFSFWEGIIGSSGLSGTAKTSTNLWDWKAIRIERKQKYLS
jgi:hypothetical protein